METAKFNPNKELHHDPKELLRDPNIKYRIPTPNKDFLADLTEAALTGVALDIQPKIGNPANHEVDQTVAELNPADTESPADAQTQRIEAARAALDRVMLVELRTPVAAPNPSDALDSKRYDLAA